MNHVFKTMLNKQTGEINVVSEKTSKSYKSHNGSAQIHKPSTQIEELSKPLPVLLKTSLSLALTAILSGITVTQVYADGVDMTYQNEISYDGSQPLVDSQNISESLLGKDKSGWIEADSNSHIRINNSSKTTPDFVIAGHAKVSKNDDEDHIDVSKNKVSVEQGSLKGNIYAGLAHFTQNTKSINCSETPSLCQSETHIGTSDTISNKNMTTSNNSIEILTQTGVFSDLTAGYAGINLNFGDLRAASAETNAYSNAYARAYSDTYINELTSKENKITINEGGSFNDLTAGYAGINLNFGDLIAANAETNAETNAYSNANANANINVYANKLTSDGNKITINKGGSFNDLTAGYAGINLNFGDLIAASAEASAYTNASAYAYSNAQSNELTSKENKITINKGGSFNDLTAGYAGINLNFGDLIAANAYASAKAKASANANANANASADINVYANKLISDGNKITINKGGSFNDLTAGYAGINLNFGDLIAANTDINANASAEAIAEANANASADINVYANKLTSDGNKITINKGGSFNDLTAGYAGININLGNITGGEKDIRRLGVKGLGDAELNINLTGTKLQTSGNEITLNGKSTITGNLHTGYIDFFIDHGRVKKADGSSGTIVIDFERPYDETAVERTNATSNNNTISIDGEHKFAKKSTIYGGYLNYNVSKDTDPKKDPALSYKPETYDVFTKNTLNYANKTPIRIHEIGNFQTYNFTLEPSLSNSKTAMITADHIILGANESNTSDHSKYNNTASNILVVGIHAGKTLATGSEFILMKVEDGLISGLGKGHESTGVVQQGISLHYDVQTEVLEDQVIAKITSGHAGVNAQLQSLLEGNLASLMLLTRGADMISDTLMSAARAGEKQEGLVPFIKLSGNSVRYNTRSDSHFDEDGGLLTAGLAFNFGDQSQYTLTGFVENGWGSYDLYNDFKTVKNVHAKGHNRYTGLGIYGLYDFNNGVYLDASLRGGNIRTSYSTNDIQNAATGESVRYDLSGTYWGTHLAAGYEYLINSDNLLDLSAKYLWTGTGSHNKNITGDEINFGRLDSHRVQLKADNHYQFSPNYSLVTGLGYEYEFDGEAKGTTYGVFEIEPGSVKGNTGLAVLGLSYHPTSNKNLSVDVQVEGYFGKRDGVNSLLNLQYKF